MTDEAPWHTTLVAAIVDARQRSVLVFDGPEGLGLPQLEVEEDMWFADGSVDLQEMLRREYGFDTVVLWSALEKQDKTAHYNLAILAVEILDQQPVPPSGSFWASRAKLATLSFAQPGYQATLEQIIEELEPGAQPAERPVWSQPGWYMEALIWIENRLSEAGYSLAAPIAQVKAWSLSVVLRAPTASGNFYFKQAARLPLFANEPRLVQALSLRYPAIIPGPLAVDLDHEWMLLKDYGTVVRHDPQERHNAQLREDAIRTWGTVQRNAAIDPERLLVDGCLDRRLPVLQAAIAPLTAAPDAYYELDPARSRLSAHSNHA